MPGNTIGQLFRLTTFGESHGAGIGGVVDGCPAGLRIDLDAIQHELDRRRPGSTVLGTARKEDDRLEILSGVFNGLTLGTPIAFVIRNTDARSTDYDALKEVIGQVMRTRPGRTSMACAIIEAEGAAVRGRPRRVWSAAPSPGRCSAGPVYGCTRM